MPPGFAVYVECFKSATYDVLWLRRLAHWVFETKLVSDVAVETKGKIFPDFSSPPSAF